MYVILIGGNTRLLLGEQHQLAPGPTGLGYRWTGRQSSSHPPHSELERGDAGQMRVRIG